MTIDEAIEILKDGELNPCVTEDREACDMAIKALEQEPCEDCISREELHKALYEHFHEEDAPNNITNVRLDAVRNFVKNFPTVVPAPKKCHNVNKDYDDCDQFVCSNCGIELQDWHQVERDEDDGNVSYHEYEFRFCPNCGAKMLRGEQG